MSLCNTYKISVRVACYISDIISFLGAITSENISFLGTWPIALLDVPAYSLRLDTFALHYYNLMSHLLYINIYCMVLVCSCRLRLKVEMVDGMQQDLSLAAFGKLSNQVYTKRRTSAWSTKWSLFAKPFLGRM